MNKKTQQDATYYVLAILGILLIILPFFFLDFSSQTMADTAIRLGLHAAAFGGAVVTAGVASTIVVKAIQHPGFVKVASWSVAAVTATSLVIAAIQLNTSPATNANLALQDSTSTDSLALVGTDSTAADIAMDTAAVVADVSTTSESRTNETSALEPKPSFSDKKKATSVIETNTQELDKPGTSGNCKDEDVGVFLAGKKVNLAEGFSFGNKSKNIRIGDECGCTATGTKITVVEKSGKTKAEKTISTPFFSLQSITALDATDRVVAEVDQVKCVNKEGISSLKKIKKLLINIVFKNDGSETIVRKRAAKELQGNEETTPVKKDKVEEDALKYGN